METFAKLFGSLLALVYHCFDRIVILGHLPLLTRPENIVHFFRNIHQVETISKEILRERTDDYHHWVEAFAKKRKIPWNGPKKGFARRTTSAPTCDQGSAGISSESTSSSRAWNWDPPSAPRFPGFPSRIPTTASSLGSIPATPTTTSMSATKCWAPSPYASHRSCLSPSPTTSGHSFIEPELLRAGVPFRKDDNAFLWVADPVSAFRSGARGIFCVSNIHFLLLAGAFKGLPTVRSGPMRSK
jgi:hypothetical protein